MFTNLDCAMKFNGENSEKTRSKKIESWKFAIPCFLTVVFYFFSDCKMDRDLLYFDDSDFLMNFGSKKTTSQDRNKICL